MSENLTGEAAADEVVCEPLAGRPSPRLRGMLTPSRLQVLGYALAVTYAASFLLQYKSGDWLIDSAGRPIFNDFTNIWIVVRQALHGDAAAVYNPVKYRDVAVAVVRVAKNLNFFDTNWAYPPIFFLVLAPFVLAPYLAAFLSFQAVTLLGCICIVYLIVRRPAAIALALASPFNIHEVTWGQTGFLRASLVGAALLTLERRPVLAGVFIGCLTYKPQFGILFPVALVAARQWRAFASAAITAAVLVGVSIAAFGIGPWAAFPRELVTQANDTFYHGVPHAPPIPWTAVQTVYGFVRAFNGGAALAWAAQGCATAGISIAVWLVWRSSARYALKAALLSAATLVATPYGWTHDLTVIVIPIAFLAIDQMRYGLRWGEKKTLVALVGMAFAIVVLCRGELPLGPVIMIALVSLILRRVLRDPYSRPSRL